MKSGAKHATSGRRLLNFKEACAHLGEMPEARLRRLVAARKIPHYRDGRLFFMSDELDDWLIAHRRPADGDARGKDDRKTPPVRHGEPAWKALVPSGYPRLARAAGTVCR